VGGPQQLLVWRECVTVTSGGTIVLLLEIIYPVKFSFTAELVSNPKPFITEALD
jgi:hypothetical protein